MWDYTKRVVIGKFKTLNVQNTKISKLKIKQLLTQDVRGGDQNQTKENKLLFERKNKLVWQVWLRKKERRHTQKTVLATKVVTTDTVEIKSAVKLESRFCH